MRSTNSQTENIANSFRHVMVIRRQTDVRMRIRRLQFMPLCAAEKPSFWQHIICCKYIGIALKVGLPLRLLGVQVPVSSTTRLTGSGKDGFNDR